MGKNSLKKQKILLLIFLIILIVWYIIFGRLLIKELKFKSFKEELTQADTYIEIKYLSSGFVLDATLLNAEEIYKVTPKNEIYVYKSNEAIVGGNNFLISKLQDFMEEKSRYNLVNKVMVNDGIKNEIYETVMKNLDEYKICDIDEYAEPENMSIADRGYMVSFDVNGKTYYDIANEAYLVNIPGENINCFVNKEFVNLINPMLEKIYK